MLSIHNCLAISGNYPTYLTFGLVVLYLVLEFDELLFDHAVHSFESATLLALCLSLVEEGLEVESAFGRLLHVDKVLSVLLVGYDVRADVRWLHRFNHIRETGFQTLPDVLLGRYNILEPRLVDSG